MRWEDEGILLSFSSFGEKSHVASVFTQLHGRHKGLYRPSRQHQATLNPGAILAANWHARLEDHLGMWQFESIYSPLAWILHDPGAMNALLSAIALIEQIFPEREPHPQLYAALKSLSRSYQTGNWLHQYVLFELALIEHSGFPLDLTQCTVSGVKEELVYVSPKTGKAVSQTAGLPYHGRLLTLPAFIPEGRQPTLEEALIALDLTEHFLERYSLGIHGLVMPQARVRFKELLKVHQKRKSS